MMILFAISSRLCYNKSSTMILHRFDKWSEVQKNRLSNGQSHAMEARKGDAMKMHHAGVDWKKTKKLGWYASVVMYKWVAEDLENAIHEAKGFGEQVSPDDAWSPDGDYDRIREILVNNGLPFEGDVIAVSILDRENEHWTVAVWVNRVA